jgi:hypothetical protein
VTWPLQILENQLYVSAAHIDIDFAAFVQVLVRVMLLSWKQLVKVSIYWHFWFHGISSIGQKSWLGGIFGIELGLGCGGGGGGGGGNGDKD